MMMFNVIVFSLSIFARPTVDQVSSLLPGLSKTRVITQRIATPNANKREQP